MSFQSIHFLAPFLVLGAVDLCAVGLCAQGLEGRPVRHELRIAPGAHVDLDTGVVLPGEKSHPFAADIVFDRDGAGFYVTPLHGAELGRSGDDRPAENRWTKARQYVQRKRESADVVLFVKTDRLAVARVTVSVVDPYSTASAVLRWGLAPGKHPVFIDGPQDLRIERKGKAIELKWAGEGGRYQVEVQSGDKTRTLMVQSRRARVAGLAPELLHRILVRELLADGVISLPTDVTVLGAPKPTRRGAIAFADRWYDRTGGVNLRTGEPAIEAADVVLYLYGVYAPGGGVLKVGRGRRVFDEMGELPEQGYLPVYGRLDESDVLAIRLGDGRFAKLFLEPTDGRDLRGGMCVHYAFLEGGGRRLLPRPEQGSFRAERGGLVLEWDAVDGAKSYRVERVGAPAGAVTTGARKLRQRLPADALHTFRIVAIAADGDESDPLVIEAHTFGDGYRIGRLTLDNAGRRGFNFAADAVVDGRKRDGVDLVITNSAGGATSLRFGTHHGATDTGGKPFGTFPPADSKPEWFRKEINTDDRDAKTQTFWVKTGDGGVACVRIRRVDYPRILLDYVWKKPTR